MNLARALPNNDNNILMAKKGCLLNSMRIGDQKHVFNWPNVLFEIALPNVAID